MICPEKSDQRSGVLIFSAALGFGLLVNAILPTWTVILNDDFGYLRSIVETIRHGRPWTDDFLEPWALSLIALSAGIFKVTGSIFFATVGLQTLMSAMSFLLVCQIARDCGFRPLASVGIAGALLTFPTLLWKQVEYTALVIYLPSLLAAVWSARRNQWALFFIAWAIAVASRSSALAWLLIPAIVGVDSTIRDRSVARSLRPFAVIMCGAVWFLAIRAYANETHAQRFITNHIFTTTSLPNFWNNSQIGLWIVAVIAGCSSLFHRGLRGPPSHRSGMAPRLGGFAIAASLLATVPFVANSVPLSFEHPFLKTRGPPAT